MTVWKFSSWLHKSKTSALLRPGSWTAYHVLVTWTDSGLVSWYHTHETTTTQNETWKWVQRGKMWWVGLMLKFFQLSTIGPFTGDVPASAVQHSLSRRKEQSVTNVPALKVMYFFWEPCREMTDSERVLHNLCLAPMVNNSKQAKLRCERVCV